MTSDAIRLTIAAVAAAVALGGAAAGSRASEKTFNQADAPQAVGQIATQDVVRGEQNTRVGHYGRVTFGPSQIAEVTVEEARGKFGGQ